MRNNIRENYGKSRRHKEFLDVEAENWGNSMCGNLGIERKKLKNSIGENYIERKNLR